MKYYIFLVYLLFSFNAFALEEVNENANIYPTWHGDIQIDKLESVLSRKLGGADVDVTSLRWTRNPAAYVAYFLQQLFPGENFAAYVINFNIDKTHEVSCNFTLLTTSYRVMVTDCKSNTAQVDVRGFIQNEEIGLPFKKKY